MLTESQQRDVLLIVGVGCDRSVAASYAGVDPRAIDATAEASGAFARELARAEANAELMHVQNIRQAAKDEKNWRASVWWLERVFPERYARKESGGVSPGDIQSLLQQVAEAIAESVQTSEERAALLRRIDSLAQQVRSGAPKASSDEEPDDEP